MLHTHAHIHIHIHIHIYIYIYLFIYLFIYLRAFGYLPPDPFLGSWNAASLFPVACSCWLVTAALWMLARHLFEEAFWALGWPLESLGRSLGWPREGLSRCQDGSWCPWKVLGSSRVIWTYVFQCIWHVWPFELVFVNDSGPSYALAARLCCQIVQRRVKGDPGLGFFYRFCALGGNL